MHIVVDVAGWQHWLACQRARCALEVLSLAQTTPAGAATVELQSGKVRGEPHNVVHKQTSHSHTQQGRQ